MGNSRIRINEAVSNSLMRSSVVVKIAVDADGIEDMDTQYLAKGLMDASEYEIVGPSPPSSMPAVLTVKGIAPEPALAACGGATIHWVSISFSGRWRHVRLEIAHSWFNPGSDADRSRSSGPTPLRHLGVPDAAVLPSATMVGGFAQRQLSCDHYGR